MKSIAFVLVAGISHSHAFQPVAFHLNSIRQTSVLGFYPEQFERAQECATHYGSCDLEELEHLADELEAFQSSEDGGGLQDRDCYVDTRQVTKMLRAQSDLKHMMEHYVVYHHQVSSLFESCQGRSHLIICLTF